MVRAGASVLSGDVEIGDWAIGGRGDVEISRLGDWETWGSGD